MGNAQLGIALGSNGKLLVVALTLLWIGKYATGMIDETQRFFDVALAIARLGVIFSNELAQRRPHLLIRGGRRDSKGFVQRRFHYKIARNKAQSDLGMFR